MKCCLCGKRFDGLGNNPYPFPATGSTRCCDECNTKLVIPKRLGFPIELEDDKTRTINGWGFVDGD